MKSSGFLGGSAVKNLLPKKKKNLLADARDAGDKDSVSGLGRFLGGGNGNLL